MQKFNRNKIKKDLDNFEDAILNVEKKRLKK